MAAARSPLIEGQEAAREVDEGRRSGIARDRDADRQGSSATFGRIGGQTGVHGLDREIRGQRRVVEVEDGRPDAVELATTVVQDRVPDGRGDRSARLASDAFGEGHVGRVEGFPARSEHRGTPRARASRHG